MRYAALAKQTLMGWLDDGALRMSASLAYYALFSFSPLLILTAGVITWMWGNTSAQQSMEMEIERLSDPTVANMVRAVLDAGAKTKLGVGGVLVGALTLLVGAAGVFNELRVSLNTIWRAETPQGPGWKTMARHYLLSVCLVVGAGLALATTFTVTAAAGELSNYVPLSPFVMRAIHALVTVALFALLFGLVMKFVPDVRIPWSDVWIGAAGTALLFELGQVLVSVYLAHSTVASVFGASSSVAALLVWLYYSAAAFFLGAKFTHVYACQFGSKKGLERSCGEPSGN